LATTSVAVWVGFIALFGTAVQTGVVMVIYLDEAVERKRASLGGRLTRADLRDAVVDGALLRLRPKVMTVSTVIAGLLPIMWSTRVGAEVMKPLATPVLGGMVSSLLHVLIVTPVIFFWIRERRLGLHQESQPDTGAVVWRPVIVGSWSFSWRLADGVAVERASTEVRETATSAGIVRLQSGDLRSRCFANGFAPQAERVHIRVSAPGKLIDVGTVRATGNMPMPGMVMSSGMEVRPSGVTGRYDGSSEFGMAGAWQMSVEWDGPAGKGSASFEGPVQ
jgi:Cu(I)/Ag(I) efflux system membrane protein CusA/SilA